VVGPEKLGILLVNRVRDRGVVHASTKGQSESDRASHGWDYEPMDPELRHKPTMVSLPLKTWNGEKPCRTMYL